MGEMANVGIKRMCKHVLLIDKVFLLIPNKIKYIVTSNLLLTCTVS